VAEDKGFYDEAKRILGDVMSLQSGLDLVAIASLGVYSETYGQSEPGNIANLAASFGYLEDAPDPSPALDTRVSLERISLSIISLTRVALSYVGFFTGEE